MKLFYCLSCVQLVTQSVNFRHTKFLPQCQLSNCIYSVALPCVCMPLFAGA